MEYGGLSHGCTVTSGSETTPGSEFKFAKVRDLIFGSERIILCQRREQMWSMVAYNLEKPNLIRSRKGASEVRERSDFVRRQRLPWPIVGGSIIFVAGGFVFIAGSLSPLRVVPLPCSEVRREDETRG